VIENIMFMKTI